MWQGTLVFKCSWKPHRTLNLHNVVRLRACVKTFSGLWASKPKGLLDGCYLECPGAVRYVQCEMLFSCKCLGRCSLPYHRNKSISTQSKAVWNWKCKKKKVEVLVKPSPGFPFGSVSISFLAWAFWLANLFLLSILNVLNDVDTIEFSEVISKQRLFFKLWL